MKKGLLAFMLVLVLAFSVTAVLASTNGDKEEAIYAYSYESYDEYFLCCYDVSKVSDFKVQCYLEREVMRAAHALLSNKMMLNEVVPEGYITILSDECYHVDNYLDIEPFSGVCIRCRGTISRSIETWCIFPQGGGYCIGRIRVETRSCICHTLTTTTTLGGCGRWHQ